jgi:hypothetical protein
MQIGTTPHRHRRPRITLHFNKAWSIPTFFQLITTLGNGNMSPELLFSDFALANLTGAKALPSAVMARLFNLPHVGSRRSQFKDEGNFWGGAFFQL